MLRQLVLRSMWNFPVRIKVRIPSSDLLSTAERSLNGLGELDHFWELSHREILYLMRYLWDTVHVWTCFWKRCHSTLVKEARDVSKYLLVLQSLSVRLHVWDVFRAISDKYKADDSAVFFKMWASNRKSFIWRNTSPVQTLRKMSGSRAAGRSMECS